MPAIPSSGAISLSDFATEFGGTAPHSMSEYYRDGGNVPSNNTNVPTSGLFRFSNMRGAINAIIQTLSNTTNVDLSSVFGSDWTSTVPKEIIIPSGVTIGGTGSSNALLVPSGMGGTLTITNAGSIIGYGGAAGGAGGNAISIASTGVTIDNTGLIAGGGGGGGSGGAGGTGGQGRYVADTNFYAGRAGSSSFCVAECNARGMVYSHSGYYTQGEDTYCCNCWCDEYVVSNGGSGGSGGSGGVGQGYNQSSTSGSAGSGGASGGTNAGAGGTGGSGGSGSAYGTAGVSGNSGSSGANGNYSNGSGGSGGASGGAAGAAIIYTAAYTMNNTGTLAGAA